MEPGSREIGMTSVDDGPCMWMVEVEEHHSDLVDQMCKEETVNGKKKTQHVNMEVDAGLLEACHTIMERN